jgi:hypothetical protein
LGHARSLPGPDARPSATVSDRSIRPRAIFFGPDRF